jgi:peroxiredoxin
MKKNTLVTIAVIMFCLTAITLLTVNSKKIEAQKIDNQLPAYQIGDIVKDFNLKNIDGKMVSLATGATAEGAILVFTCNHCPYAKAYESRIVALNNKYKVLGYPVIAINANYADDNEEDSMNENLKIAKEKGFNFPYLKDETQEIAAAYGAKRTPSVYVLKRENDKYILKYSGAIDDNSQSAKDVTKKYVELAIGELLLGKNVSTTTTKSIGCGIKWKNV